MGENINFLEEVSKFNFVNKYARYNETANRRETWDECITRDEKMHLKKFKKILSKEDLNQIKWAFNQVRQRKIVPSMRSLQFAGKAIEKINLRIYNCAVRHVDSIRSFSEIFYLLLCGNGVGIGLSEHFLNRLPDLVTASDKTGTVINYTVEDSIEGWSDSIEALLNCYFRNTAYTGRKIVFDYSKIRKRGAELKTAGGKAPGYQGLKACHIKVKKLLDQIIENLNQKRLKSINAYDILMHCSDAVLSGGIRRSATAIIFEPSDTDMLNAKTYFPVEKHTKFYFDEELNKYIGKITINKQKFEVELSEYEHNDLIENKRVNWLHVEPQRARSNNSVLLIRNQVKYEDFKEILNKTKQFGEPGFVFADHKWQLYNPCYEVGFLPVTEDGVCGVQFCNLTSINGAAIKTKEDFYEAVKAATIIGTLQASYTEFDYLSHTAKQLTEEEALLGVSITGIMDNPDVLLNTEIQRTGASIATIHNLEWSQKIGINPAARITNIKPEGNTSLILGSASGIHAHHAYQYWRRLQCNKTDPVYKFFKKHNPHMCEPSVWSANKTDDVVKFPITIPTTAVIKSDLTAIEHLEKIKSTQQNWVIPGTTSHNKKPIHHNVSCTVIVDEHEWDDVFRYLFENREYFAAVSLLPKTGDKIYPQAPMEAIVTEEDKQEWERVITQYTPVDYTNLTEKEDNTNAQETVACGGGACELTF